MSREAHWKPEEYDWDPHRLHASRRAAPKAKEPPDNESEVTHTQDPAGTLAKKGSMEQAASADDTAAHSLGDHKDQATSGPQAGASTGEGSPADMSSGGTGSAGPRSTGDAPSSREQPVPVVRDTLASVVGPSKKRIPLQCQVDGCHKDLSKEKEYYQRYRICEDHLKLSSLLKDGIEQRFCQQCGRFHVLADFDAEKRSCRARLNLHNDRRRKRVPEHNTPRQDLQNPQPRGRRTRTRRKRLLYGEQAGSDELEALDAEVEAAESDGKPETRRGSWRPQVGGQPQELLGEGPLTQSPTHPRGRVQQAWGLTPAYRGYPVEMNAALHGLLPALTTCLPGSVIEERYLSSPIPSLTHFSHHALRPSDPGSPLSLPYASQLAGEADVHALEMWLYRQQALQQRMPTDQETVRSRVAEEQGQPGLFKSASEPVYGLPRMAAAPRTAWAGNSVVDMATRTRSDGSGSPVRDYHQAALRFRSGPAHDLLYEQQAQLLRGSSWSLREESQRQQLQQAAADLDMSTFPAPRRHASQSPTVGSHVQLGASMLAPRLPPGDAALLSRFSSDRDSNIVQLLSGGSDSSLSQFHPLNTQESAGSRHGGSGGQFSGRFSVSEAAASLQRINSGSVRLASSPSGQQSHIPTSSPLGPAPGAPGPSRRGSEDQPGHPHSRRSDPGVWAQQYQGFHGEGLRSYDRHGEGLCEFQAGEDLQHDSGSV